MRGFIPSNYFSSGRKIFFIAFSFLSLSLSSSARAEGGEVLFGAAAITGAVSAMVVPGIMANSQTQVKQIQAQTATQLTAMNSQTAYFQAKLQSDLAMMQTQFAYNQAASAQRAQTDQLMAMLQFSAYNRFLDDQFAREQRARDMEIQQAYLNLESKKMFLNQILTETSLIAGDAPATLQSTLNINNRGATSPMGAALASVSNNSGGGLAASAGDTSVSQTETGLGLRKTLSTRLSSGSTRERRNISDLSLFNAGVGYEPGRSFRASSGTPHARRTRAISSIGSQQTHRNR
jgi:hypothetical protein